MVIWTKILPLVAAGVGIMFLVNAFTRPAHASQTAGAISDTFGSIGTLGESIAGFGQGIGTGLAGLFQPVWEVANLFERFSNLSGGAANVSPVAQENLQVMQLQEELRRTPGSPSYNACATGHGCGSDGATWTVTSGGTSGGYTASASDTGGGSLTSGNFGGTDTSTGWGI